MIFVLELAERKITVYPAIAVGAEGYFEAMVYVYLS